MHRLELRRQRQVASGQENNNKVVSVGIGPGVNRSRKTQAGTKIGERHGVSHIRSEVAYSRRKPNLKNREQSRDEGASVDYGVGCNMVERPPSRNADFAVEVDCG